jgi:hypothetical protein
MGKAGDKETRRPKLTRFKEAAREVGAKETTDASRTGDTLVEFYAQAGDEEKCLQWLGSRVTITGLTPEGKIAAFTGVVRNYADRQTKFPYYPLLVRMIDATVTSD